MSSSPRKIKVKIEPSWHGNYRLEYDGKYITLFGEDKDYIGFKWNKEDEDWYEEMVLSCICEGRNLSPTICAVTKNYIYIDAGIDNPRLCF